MIILNMLPRSKRKIGKEGVTRCQKERNEVVEGEYRVIRNTKRNTFDLDKQGEDQTRRAVWCMSCEIFRTGVLKHRRIRRSGLE